MKHTFTWHGHSNFMVESGDKTIIIDPFFEGNPAADITYDKITKADIVLITHDHHDHIGQAAEICKATGAALVCIYELVPGFIKQGLPQDKVFGINVGGTIEIEGFKIKMVQAMHSAQNGSPAGFIVTADDGFCFYFAGDTGLFSSMELFGKFHDIDLALLPIGGLFTMDSKEAAYACKMLGCQNVIPMHFKTFPVLEQNTTNFKKHLDAFAPKTKLQELTPGKSFTISK